MSGTPEPSALRPRTSLYDHALRLHRQHPESALPNNGEPYPDDAPDRRLPASGSPDDPRRRGVDVAAILDAHFARADATPSELAGAFYDVHVPIHRNEQIVAAALRAERERVQHTGRWLVRHSTDRRSAVVGLALLATDRAPEDIPLIQTIGLLSDTFGPLAADALRRRCADGGIAALLWLADRAAGWGRVYVVRALCELAGFSDVRSWLLRRSCTGDFLDGYYVGRAAEAAHLPEAINADDADDELIDHAGRTLAAMTDCEGQGLTLQRYLSARPAIDAYARHLGRQRPALDRYLAATTIAACLTGRSRDDWAGCSVGQRKELAGRLLRVLDRAEWYETARAGLDPGNGYHAWLAQNVAPRLRLRAFTDFRVGG